MYENYFVSLSFFLSFSLSLSQESPIINRILHIQAGYHYILLLKRIAFLSMRRQYSAQIALLCDISAALRRAVQKKKPSLRQKNGKRRHSWEEEEEEKKSALFMSNYIRAVYLQI